AISAGAARRRRAAGDVIRNATRRSNVMNRTDTEALKQTHTVQAIAAGYGIEMRPSGRALIARCPFHHDGGRPNLYVYPASQSWYCYRCAIGGDVISFVRRMEQVGFKD